MLAEATQEQLRNTLFGNSGYRAWAVLDGASVEHLPQLLWKHAPQHVCLYRGELAPDIAAVAPYLVRMDIEHSFTKLALEEGWGQHWGVFALIPADVTITEVRKHFRRFLMVKTPDGKSLYFRYYDPRVLTSFAATCNAEELRTLFGPVVAYIAEGSSGTSMNRLSLVDGKLRVESEVMTRQVEGA